jgi:four helix bundle protein
MDSKYLELEKRTQDFSIAVRNFCLLCKHDLINREYIKQVVRSAGSVGANYIEANDSLGVNDKKMKMRISKKEAKETCYWLTHILTYHNEELEQNRLSLLKEANELMLIFAAILRKLD